MKTRIKRFIRNQKRKKAERLADHQRALLPDGIDRVYHIHLRKTAGTSINAAFWSLAGIDLKSAGREPVLVKNKRVFV